MPVAEVRFLIVAYIPISDLEIFFTRHTTEQDGVAATFWTLILKINISNLGRDTGYLD
jgi:hypothetical protein